jgi:hypothetical protein
MADQGNWGFFERIAARAQSAATNLRVRSALNPMLWLCAIVSLPCFIFALLAYWFHLPDLGLLFVYLGALPLGATILGFLYFAVFDPKRLQSEEYQIRHEALELIKEKGSPLELSPTSLEAIANPLRALLPRGDR